MLLACQVLDRVLLNRIIMRDNLNKNMFIALLFGSPDRITPKEHRYYYLLLSTGYIGLLIHIWFLSIFIWINVEPLIYFNIVSCFIWLVIIFLLRTSENMLPAASLIISEAMAHQVYSVYILGWDYGFQYYLILPVTLVYFGFYKSKVAPLLVSVSSILLFFIGYFYLQTISEHPVADPLVKKILYSINIISMFLLSGTFSYVYSAAANKAESDLEKERQRSEDLLLNILPISIVHRLKEEQSVIADHFDSTTILFADIAGFTRLAEALEPIALVSLLNRIFSSFDSLVEKYSLEKIKTIGDAYMVSGGLPDPKADHLEAIADLALAMKKSASGFTIDSVQPIDIRIGIHTGPAVAGIIGNKKFSYDVWGDTVNTASRMESHGVIGQIQVSDKVYQGLQDKYLFSCRGEISIKGKGMMKTYFLQGKK